MQPTRARISGASGGMHSCRRTLRLPILPTHTPPPTATPKHRPPTLPHAHRVGVSEAAQYVHFPYAGLRQRQAHLLLPHPNQHNAAAAGAGAQRHLAHQTHAALLSFSKAAAATASQDNQHTPRALNKRTCLLAAKAQARQARQRREQRQQRACIVCWNPAQSITTLKPSVAPAARASSPATSAGAASGATWTATSAPSRRATSRFSCFRSVMATRSAPNARTASSATKPAGT
jgi:hypothetical protein